jgi:hypothetical protein
MLSWREGEQPDVINLDTAKLVMYGLAVVLFLSFGASWYVRGIQIDNLRTELIQTKADLSEANGRIRQAQNAARIASERFDAMRLEERAINEAVSQARRQGGNNEQISPTIRSAIDSINRMRGGTSNPTGPSGNPR